MNVAQALERSAFYYPDRTALVFQDRRWGYRELEREASALASGLMRLGLRPGERIALQLPNRPEFVLTYYAALKLGAVPLSLNVTYKAEEIAYIVQNAEASLLVTSAPVASNLPPLSAMPSVRRVVRVDGPAELTALRGDPGLRAVDLDREETAAILYTSATTGRPKGVVLSHANIVSNVWAANHHLQMTHEDRGICALPLFHSFGQNFVMNALINCGGTLVLQERFLVDELLSAIGRERITLLYGVPTMYLMILAGAPGACDLSSVRLCFSAAAGLPDDVERRWHERFGHWIHQGYGLTETSPFASYNHAIRFRSGSVGTPIENVEMKVVDEAGRELPDREPGEILIKGPNVMKGYFRDPEATARAIEHGWLHTGDIGYRDQDGYFFVVDRLKDMVNVAGFKVFPREVEELLFQHHAVKEVAVVGVPHPVKGEAVKAFVVLEDGETVAPDALKEFCRERIASYKVPEEFLFVSVLPKNPTGKILKNELRLLR
jgi:long-chain acyl-CoA synthetase